MKDMVESGWYALYSPIKSVDIGGEWMYGERKTFSHQTGTLSRVGLLARYRFD